MNEFIIFTDNWWNAFVHDYAFTLALLWVLLKCLAVLDKSTESNKVIELLQNFFNRGGGTKAQ